MRQGGLSGAAVPSVFFCLLLLSGCGGDNSGGPGSDDQAPAPVVLEPNPEPPATGNTQLGVMGKPAAWPVVPIHMGLTPDGRLLSFGRESADAQVMIYDVWDYAKGLGEDSHLTLPNTVGTDLFCANQLMLSSGKMLMTGGDTREGGTSQMLGWQTGAGNADATVFDPLTDRLSTVGTMREGRWYATMTMLPNGEVFIQGGSGINLSERPRFTEVATADGSQYRSLTGFEVYDLPWLYPRNFVAPNGSIVGWSKRYAYRLYPEGNGQRVDFGIAPQVRLDDGFLSVMYRPGKVLLAGGRSTRAIRADITGPVPVYESVPALSSPRIYGTATVLPSGDVLISNGGDTDTSAADAGLGEPAYHVSIYNPESNTFARGPASEVARLYHSASILLPDATVLLGGGGLPGPVTNLNAEIYYPGYLFDENGDRAIRPMITAAPMVLDVKTSFTLEVDKPGDIERVVLVKTGAVTHSVDMGQRFVELSFSQEGTGLQVSLPQNPAHTTPGFYHVFVLNRQGVPSVSRIVRINSYQGALPQPTLAGTVSEITGLPIPNRAELSIGSDIAAFELMCGADELLVGLHGEIDDSLRAVGPVCIRANRQTGEWTGPKKRRPAAGRMMAASSPSVFERSCPSAQAMIGFELQTLEEGDMLGQPELICRALANGPLPDAGGLPEQSKLCPGASFSRGIRGVQTRGTPTLNNDAILGFGLRCEPG